VLVPRALAVVFAFVGLWGAALQTLDQRRLNVEDRSNVAQSQLSSAVDFCNERSPVIVFLNFTRLAPQGSLLSLEPSVCVPEHLLLLLHPVAQVECGATRSMVLNCARSTDPRASPCGYEDRERDHAFSPHLIIEIPGR
jgi:hypothetical protein